jgi:MFS family permease
MQNTSKVRRRRDVQGGAKGFMSARLSTLSTHTDRWVLVAAILGSSMVFIDATAVNVALPLIQHDLLSSNEDLQWTVEGYALLLSAFLLVGGALGDVYGRRGESLRRERPRYRAMRRTAPHAFAAFPGEC